MLQKIVPYGRAEFTVAASDVIHVYSQDDAKVYTKPTSKSIYGLLAKTVGGTEYASSAVSVATDVRIEAGGREVLYNYGVAPAILARRGLRGQGAPIALNATGDITVAMIAGGIITTTVAQAVTATLPTGTVMDAGLEMEIGDAIDWCVSSNTGANAFTVTADTGHTVVGLMAVATTCSALFRTRKTAAETYVTYALAIAAS